MTVYSTETLSAIADYRDLIDQQANRQLPPTEAERIANLQRHQSLEATILRCMREDAWEAAATVLEERKKPQRLRLRDGVEIIVRGPREQESVHSLVLRRGGSPVEVQLEESELDDLFERVP